MAEKTISEQPHTVENKPAENHLDAESLLDEAETVDGLPNEFANGEWVDAPDAVEAVPEAERLPPGGPADDPVLDRPYSKAWLIDLDGAIFDRFHWYLNNRLDLAQAQGADLVILRLTSPGGDLEHSLQLARRLRDIDWARTIVFIPQEAISGGAIIALGCDRIVMQTGALIGDAGPIRMGLGGQFEHAEEKVVSYLASAIRELALAHERPAALAEAMVDRSLVVYEATELATGKRVYLTEKERSAADIAMRYDVGQPVPESGQNRFLTLGAARARELGISDVVLASERELLERLAIVKLESTRMNWVDRLVFLLNRPWVSALLLVAGLIGLYLEFTAPGISVAGLTAFICFGIFFWSHALGGTAGWLEVLLFALGITCLVFELFILPGFGIFGLSGLSLLVLSLVMASQDFIVPDDASEWNQLRTNLLVVLGAVLGVTVLFFGQILLLDSIPGMNRFRLAAPESRADAETATITGLIHRESSTSRFQLMPGARGQAESDLRPSGKVKMEDELFDVITEGDYVDAGSPVEVLRIEGNRIVVRRLL